MTPQVKASSWLVFEFCCPLCTQSWYRAKNNLESSYLYLPSTRTLSEYQPCLASVWSLFNVDSTVISRFYRWCWAMSFEYTVALIHLLPSPLSSVLEAQWFSSRPPYSCVKVSSGVLFPAKWLCLMNCFPPPHHLTLTPVNLIVHLFV